MPQKMPEQKVRRKTSLALISLGGVIPALLIIVAVDAVQKLTLEIPWLFLGSIALVGLALLAGGIRVLLHHGGRTGVLFFLLAQAWGAASVLGMRLSGGWESPVWMRMIFPICALLALSLLFHFFVTDPILCGSPPRIWLAVPHGLVVFAGLAAPFFEGLVWDTLALGLGILLALAAFLVGCGVYLRAGSPRQRQKLRIRAVGGLLGALPVIFGWALPHFWDLYAPWFPSWLSGVFLFLIPAGIFTSLFLRRLYHLDRLLVDAGITAVVFLIAAPIGWGLYVWITPLLPPGQVVLALFSVLLSLVLGWGVGPLWRGLHTLAGKRLNDGLRPEPLLMEKASRALAGCLSRRELNQVLTRDIPGMLGLSGAKLWFGEAAFAPTRKADEPQLNFELKFQAKVRAIWSLYPFRDGRPFSSQDRRILAALAEQAEVTLRNVLLVESLRRQLDEIRAGQALLAEAQHQLLRSRDNERSRLARDLHDGPVQTLVALNLALGLLDVGDGIDLAELSVDLGEMRREVKGLIGELRQVCAQLRPPLLDTLGLGPAIQSLAEDWSAETGVVVTAEISASAEDLCLLPDEAMVNLYRIVQEGLHNIGKHARATHVDICLTRQNNLLVLQVADDGAGFAVPDTLRGLTQGGHFGLVGMRERVNLIGGKWSLVSQPGKGTVVKVTLPLREAGVKD